MYSIEKDYSTGVLVISEQYQNGRILSDYIVLKFGKNEEVYDVVKFNTFHMVLSGMQTNINLELEYRISRDGFNYGMWLPMINDTNLNDLINAPFRIENFPIINQSDRFFMDVKILKDHSGVNVSMMSYELGGRIERNLESGDDSFILKPGDITVIKPPYIFKVFKIVDVEILMEGVATIKYRFSQDNGRTVSSWEPLTKANISTVRINPIRFFQIEYLVENTTKISAKINDINLIGDFQNVTMDYLKSNLYGMRDNCNCVMLNIVDGQPLGVIKNQNADNKANANTITDTYCAAGSGLKPMSMEERANLFNPYEQTQAIDFLNTISNDANAMFGHEVVYFVTNADSNGIDYTFHEYQLYNYVCSETIKVSVDNNAFPDNQISINQFDLSLFESFEIHVTKDDFKRLFGVDKRPSKEDFLWFCALNRMFQVEHAQPFRQFNNAAIYYKVLLKKYSQKANVVAGDKNIEDRIRELTRNSTIDELFGMEVEQDKASVANKEQFNTLTKDTLRLETSARIVKQLIESRTNVISKSHYDLGYSDPGKQLVKYRNMKNNYSVSDNVGFYAWFNIDEYVTNDSHNLFNYHNGTDGFRFDIVDDATKVTLNGDTYMMEFGTPLGSFYYDDMSEGKWFAYLVNIDQRQGIITQYMYKISDMESPSLEMVYKKEEVLNKVEFFLGDMNASVLGSETKLTNITLFGDVIPEDQHIKLLSSPIIRDDYKHLIFTDNANMKLILANHSISQNK
jgi:hypothetical protein